MGFQIVTSELSHLGQNAAKAGAGDVPSWMTRQPGSLVIQLGGERHIAILQELDFQSLFLRTAVTVIKYMLLCAFLQWWIEMMDVYSTQ